MSFYVARNVLERRYDDKGAAKFLGVGRKQLQRLIDDGLLPYYWTGQWRCFDHANLEALRDELLGKGDGHAQQRPGAGRHQPG
jgi:excisionase family DNA binding protein